MHTNDFRRPWPGHPARAPFRTDRIAVTSTAIAAPKVRLAPKATRSSRTLKKDAAATVDIADNPIIEAIRPGNQRALEQYQVGDAGRHLGEQDQENRDSHDLVDADQRQRRPGRRSR